MSDFFDDDGMLERFKSAKGHLESTVGPISDIKKHVEGLFSSSSLSSNLWVEFADDRIKVDLGKLFHRDIRASVLVQQDSDYERAVLDFLSERGLEIPKESPLPESFFPNLPVYLICDINPIPGDAIKLAQLLSDLFRYAGFKDKTQVSYHRFEISDGAPPRK